MRTCRRTVRHRVALLSTALLSLTRSKRQRRPGVPNPVKATLQMR